MGYGAMWRPEQKKLSLMKNFAGKFSRGGKLNMDFCPGTRPTAKACMLLDQRRTFPECDLDSVVLSTVESDPSTFALQM